MSGPRVFPLLFPACDDEIVARLHVLKVLTTRTAVSASLLYFPKQEHSASEFWRLRVPF